jgi:nitrous oxide reductase
MSDAKPGIQAGMGNTVSEAPKMNLAATLAEKVAEGNKPAKADGYYSIHSGKCCGKVWPMNDPFVPTTQEELDVCESLVARGYGTLVGKKPTIK